MPLGPYTSFIVTSYVLVTAVVLILIVWIAIDYRRQKARLRELEADWSRGKDDGRLVDGVFALAEQFGKADERRAGGKRLAREDLKLICFEYISP